MKLASAYSKDTILMDDTDSDLGSSDAGERPCYRRRGFKRITFGALAIVLIVIVISVIMSLKKTDANVTISSSSSLSSYVEIPVNCGKVSGTIESGVFVFRGIPYVEHYDNRAQWLPPIALKEENCEPDVVVNQGALTPCYQLDPFAQVSEWIRVGGPDCLELNVYTPSLNSSKPLPVMVFIHGGWLITGSGSRMDWTPTPALAQELNAVIVSVNYRLSVFGWLALQLFETYDNRPSGNYGLQDQIEAIKWVNGNIQSFRGDPRNVTLVGHGSGGTCIIALMTMPEMEGLFQRAWAFSPSATYEQDKDKVYHDNELSFLTRTSCQSQNINSTIFCLRGDMDPSKALKWSPYTYYPNWGPIDRFSAPKAKVKTGALLFVDGDTVKKTPIQALRSKQFMDIPLIISSTREETDLLQSPRNLSNWNWSDFEVLLTQLQTDFDLNLSDLKSYMEPDSQTPMSAYARLTTDLRLTCALDSLSHSIAQTSTKNIYRVVTEARPSSKVHYGLTSYGSELAYHGWDLQAILGAFRGKGPASSSDIALAGKLKYFLKEFLHTGKVDSWQVVSEKNAFTIVQTNGTVTHGTVTVRPLCEKWLGGNIDNQMHLWHN